MINNFALIIGAMKCGTTSIFNCLVQHPEIAGCRYKEPHFFSKAKNFAKGFDYYQSLWDQQDYTHKIALEATPGYTKVTHQDSANAAANIAQVQREHKVEFKFIYVMRDPLERIESHYLHNVLKGNEANLTAVSQIDQSIIDTSKYAMQLDEYYQRFAADKILLLDFAQFKIDPDQSLRQICQFLNIDSSFQFNQVQKIHNGRQRLRFKLPLVNSLRRTQLAKSLRSAISEEQKYAFKSKFGSRKKVSFKLPEQLKAEITQEIKPDLVRLQESYNFKSNSWKIEF
ncbi:MAG: sulfotransferase [Cyanobacteria bacterium J06631_2]